MKPLTLPEIRDEGFEPSSRGWLPRTPEARRAIEEADERRTGGPPRSPLPPWPERTEECFICGWPAEASLVGTPTCSRECLAIAAEQDMPEIGLRALPGKNPPPPFNWRLNRILSRKPRKGTKPSLEKALVNLGTCEEVLARHGIYLRGRRALCPFHEERTPSLNVYSGRDGKPMAKCFGCGWFGDALELEVSLSGREKARVIEEWSL